MTGRFITFEGIDGAGKSTHIDALFERLRQAGHDVVCTREPGGTALAEQLREMVLHSPMDALTEALLVFAARRDHIQQVIAPALAQGRTVLCDRFTDASFAYQGAGRGFDIGMLNTLEGWVQQGLQPDLTFLFDVSAEVAAERRMAARSPDRFEKLDIEFFDRVRQGYEARLLKAPQRFAKIDAAQSREQVWAQVVVHMEQRGW
jgi:dTMP kinase